MNEPELRRKLDELFSEQVCSVKRRELSTLDELLREAGNQVVLFGSGNLGHRALKLLRGIGIEPLGFADNNEARWGTVSDGLTIFSPKEAADKFGNRALFIVSIWSLGHNFRDTRRKLIELGCSRITPVAALRWKFADELLPFYNQDLPHKVYEQADEVCAAASLWSDDQSRREYLNQVRFRTHGDHGSMELPCPAQQYFPEDLFALSPDEEFVDCGAYDGDTARTLIDKQDANFRHIFEIEPDSDNLSSLRAWVESLEPAVSKRITLLDVAVGSSRKKVRFNATGSTSAGIAVDGGSFVECAPLDELLSDRTPTYIKMDIEGAEMEAIQGARKVIQRSRPILGVCAYHAQDDLWRIPVLIHSLVPEYRLFLRPHEVEGWELVCYAVPPHRLAGIA